MEVRPLIFVESDSEKTHSGGGWAGMHTSLVEPLQMPHLTMKKLILSVSSVILG